VFRAAFIGRGVGSLAEEDMERRLGADGASPLGIGLLISRLAACGSASRGGTAFFPDDGYAGDKACRELAGRVPRDTIVQRAQRGWLCRLTQINAAAARVPDYGSSLAIAVLGWVSQAGERGRCPASVSARIVLLTSRRIAAVFALGLTAWLVGSVLVAMLVGYCALGEE
jgi:hypothetical protein